jgi:hypothetical protein
MAELISARADVGRIEDHVRRAWRAAQARTGEIAEAATERLEPAVASIDSALALKKSTEEAEATAWSLVLAEDTKSDELIGSVRDAMWNAIGRTRQNAALDQVFPGGVRTYTSGDPRAQPLLMQVLESRVTSAAAPQWTDAMKQGWVAELEAARSSYATAVEAHRPIEAAAQVAMTAYRAAVRTGQARLRAFKRDLQNLGLSEVQIHEIIPDASSHAAPPAPGPAPVPAPSARDGA